MPEINLERDLHTGRRLGRYEIVCQMSAGGMSEIYLGFQRGMGGFTKIVALKCFSQALGDDAGLLGMFLDEGRITASLAHPNIGQIYDLGEQEGEFYFAMEFIQGATLIELARALKPLNEGIPVGFALATARDVALALHHAHTFTDSGGRSQPIVHRDVAGKNIMVTYDGVTKLFDFGIAKFASQIDKSRVAGVKGTSGYMAPEQIRGRKVDARTDVFALAVVLHESLTGNRLFHGKTLAEEIQAALEARAPPPSSVNPEVPEALDTVILRALEKEPDRRFPSALEFGRALEAAAASLFWKPEQRGELMLRNFSKRRERAQALFASLPEDAPARASDVPRRMTPAPAPVRVTPPPAPPRKSALMAPIPGPPQGIDLRTVPMRKGPPTPPPSSAPTDPGEEPPTQLGPPPGQDPSLFQTIAAAASPLVAKPPALHEGIAPFGDTERSESEPKTVVAPAPAPPPQLPIAPLEAVHLPEVDAPDTGALTQVTMPRRHVLAKAVAATLGVLALSVGAIWAARRAPPPRDDGTSPLVVRGVKATAAAAEPAAPQHFSPEPRQATKWPETLRFDTKPADPKRAEPKPEEPARAEPPAPAPRTVEKPKAPVAPSVRKSALVLETTPSAQVRLGQRFLGNTPINVNLPPGTYDLSLLGPDGAERHLTVKVTASANTVIKLPLSVVPTQ